MSLVHPKIGKIVFKKNRSKTVVLVIWLYNFILISAGLGLNIIGYDRDLGKCDFLSEKHGMDPRKIVFPIGFGIPACLIVFSYTGLIPQLLDENHRMCYKTLSSVFNADYCYKIS